MEKSFLFLPKPVLLLHHHEITKAEFQRVGSGIGNPRTFDFQLVIGTTEHTFSNINKEEAQCLEEFLIAKQIPFTKDNGSASARKYFVESEEEGRVFFAHAESDEREERGRKKKVRLNGEEEEEESTDEDYVAESESSVAEEYNEDYSGSEEDESGEWTSEVSESSNQEDNVDESEGASP